jgi:hypothetical protein
MASKNVGDEDSIRRTVEALKARNVNVLVVDDGAQALAKLKELVPEGSVIFNNTSETLDSIGYSDYVHQNPKYRNLHDEMEAETDPAKQRNIRRQATMADYFIGSVQAVAETGEVVVASGSGSQIAAYVYNAEHLIWLAGTQKICPGLPEAMDRVRGYTLERHDSWLQGRGRNPSPIGKLMVFENEVVAGRITMILINESLGW